ncbi:MAG: FAD-dependent monooxygenase, partial [Acetobacteraceae bacterium]|nr:FAD-dependent monooxygenase [Acetobacteraceae bacterium]
RAPAGAAPRRAAARLAARFLLDLPRGDGEQGMRIGVIGTGVVGSLFLDRLRGVKGLELAAFERAAEGAREEAGTGLNICPNALKALRLHHPERHAALRAASLPWERWFVDLADGTRLLDLDLRDVAEEPGARLRWSELYGLMRGPVAGVTAYGHALEALEEDAAGRLVPVFRRGDGGLARRGGFDLLVAGDGRYSRLRALAAGAPVVEQIGISMTRLLVPDASGCPFDDYGQWFNGNNRLLAYRLPGGAAYIAGAFPVEPGRDVPPEHRTAEHARAMYLPAGKQPCPAVAWMVAQTARLIGQLHWARLQVTPLLRDALDRRVLFLGDAAHAMVPTLGQGATQAIEDGVLAAAVFAAGGGVREVAALRDARVRFIREFSLEATDTMIPGSDTAALTRRKGEPPFLEKLRRAYTDVPEVVRLPLAA